MRRARCPDTSGSGWGAARCRCRCLLGDRCHRRGPGPACTAGVGAALDDARLVCLACRGKPRCRSLRDRPYGSSRAQRLAVGGEEVLDAFCAGLGRCWGIAWSGHRTPTRSGVYSKPLAPSWSAVRNSDGSAGRCAWPQPSAYAPARPSSTRSQRRRGRAEGDGTLDRWIQAGALLAGISTLYLMHGPEHAALVAAVDALVLPRQPSARAHLQQTGRNAYPQEHVVPRVLASAADMSELVLRCLRYYATTCSVSSWRTSRPQNIPAGP